MDPFINHTENSMKAVSFTFDDGLEIHLDAAMPLIEQYGFRGTFFVNPVAPCFTRRLDGWREAARRGHELGNHTLFHPAWKSKPYVTPGNDIEHYTTDRMRIELEAASRLLEGLDGSHRRTFAYPCCNTVLGRPGVVKRMLTGLGLNRTRLMGWVNHHTGLDLGSSEQSYATLAADLFVASRTGGETFSGKSGNFPPPKAEVPCIMLDGKSWPEVQSILDDYEKAPAGWLVFAVHGIGGGHRLSCDAGLFDHILQSIKQRAWPVKTFGAVALELFGDPS